MAFLKKIVLFGAGKSATVLIDYLKDIAAQRNWQVVIADNDLAAVEAKAGGHPNCVPLQLNISNEAERKKSIHQADIVISMMPHALHYLIAVDCIAFRKHLLTASYVDESIKSLGDKIKAQGLIFLCEMGLDPGIDHMSAMQLFHRIKDSGGKIISFASHCGGLVAPESDDNPWHYKISWNPRNIILAGKAGAVYREANNEIHLPYEHLFDPGNMVDVPGEGTFAYYPNRDSLGYIALYELEDAATFIRTTLRHPDFSQGWKNIIDLKLTDEEKVYDTDGMSVAGFFEAHMLRHDLNTRFRELTVAEEDIEEAAGTSMATPALNIAARQLNFLDPHGDKLINKGLCSAADVLQFILEEKLALKPHDKDMILMLHEITYVTNDKVREIKSSLVVKGEDSVHTAMAKTVGLPLGIAAKLILENKITTPGLHIPVTPEIYEPVLAELQEHGVRFHEQEYDL